MLPSVSPWPLSQAGRNKCWMQSSVWGLLRTCSSPEHLQPEANSKRCPASHLCPFRVCTLTAGPSYLQMISFRALQTSKQPPKMQAEITKLAQASMSNLQLLELPKRQNGSCIEQLLHALDWKLCRHPVRMWESAAEDYTMGGSCTDKQWASTAEF